MNLNDLDALRPSDVVRARRFGNKGLGNYVLDRIHEVDEEKLQVTAHNEYSGRSGRFMVLDSTTVTKLRSYA